MADDETSGADENQPGWAAPGQAPREPAAPAPPAPGEQMPPPPPPSATPSSAWQAAPAAPGLAQGAVPPGVPRRGGHTWLFLLIALISVTVIMVIVGSVLFVNRTLPPYDGAHDFLSDLTHLRDNAATARLCAADRENGESAIAKIRSTFGRSGRILVNPLQVDRTGDHALVKYSVDLAGTDRTPSYDLAMRKENGRWLACPLSGED